MTDESTPTPAPAPSHAPSDALSNAAEPDPVKTLELKPHVVEAISTVFDPEIPVNIYELGLIYDIVIDAAAVVHVSMTLTSPACPSAQQIPVDVATKIRAIPGVSDVDVQIVWEPAWTMEKMSDAARLQLGIGW
jgi:FeS assembly SUF system protein